MTTSDDKSPRFAVYSQLALILVLLAHLPTLVEYWQGLWSRVHYQFFPFAYAAFAWMLWTRRIPAAFRWDIWSALLIAADLACVGLALKINSPFFFQVGFLFALSALCRSYRDIEYECSLFYLMLLPLIAQRLPLGYDERMIHWLQRVTTGVASNILNFFGFLHLRTGNILEFPGRRFMVEEACSGVQSLFTLLFLASLIVCGYRRRWPIALMVLGSAAGLAGLLNVMRVCTVAIAWDMFEMDLSTGWQHDALGYTALVIAALLVLSCDALFAFIATPVPDEPSAGISAVFRNPISAVWNFILLRAGRKDGRIRIHERRPIPLEKVAFGAAAIFCVCLVAVQLADLNN